MQSKLQELDALNVQEILKIYSLKRSKTLRLVWK